MAEASKLYLKSIFKQVHYIATWLPNTNLKLGDIGYFDGECFKRMTSLEEQGVLFKIRSGKDSLDLSYTSESGVALRFKAAGNLDSETTLPAAKAGVLMSFSNEGAFFFQANKCLIDEIEDKTKVGHTVIELYKKGKWEDNFCVIDTIVKAKSATIIISNSRSSTLEFTARLPVTNTNIANVDTGLSINSQKGEVTQLIAVEGLTPLFKVSRLKMSVLKVLLGAKRPLLFKGMIEDNSLSIDDEVFEPIEP